MEYTRRHKKPLYEAKGMWPGFDSRQVSHEGGVCPLLSPRSEVEVFLRVLRFSSLHKLNISKFQFNQYRERTWKPAKADVASCLYTISFPELRPPCSGSNHFEITKEITEFCPSGFSAQSQSAFMACYGACLKWLLPELSFSDRWSRRTKLWKRDCSI